MAIATEWHLSLCVSTAMPVERLSTFQAVRFSTWSYEATKRAHPLWREGVGVVRRSWQVFIECEDGPKKTADTNKE